MDTMRKEELQKLVPGLKNGLRLQNRWRSRHHGLPLRSEGARAEGGHGAPGRRGAGRAGASGAARAARWRARLAAPLRAA